MGEPQIAVHSFSKMKAFVAVLSAMVAAASGTQLVSYAGYAPYTYNYGAVDPFGYAAAAPAPVAVAHAPIAYATVNPYDYAGQIYPVAEPYIHEEIPAEEYVHEEIAAEPYVHEEIAAEPYVHEEIPAEAYVHEEIPAEAYVHEETPAEAYIHQEPIAVAPVAVAAPAPVVSYAAYNYAPAGYPFVAPAAAVKSE